MGRRIGTLETMVNPDPGFWAGRSVLVTGNTGFKGVWLTLWLTRLGARVFGFALEPETAPSMFGLCANEEVATTFGDVRRLDELQKVVAGVRPEIVFHLAAQSLVRPSYEDPVGTYETNVMGTVNLLEAVRRSDCVRAVVIVTSDKCYENREWVWAYRENEPMGGYDPYSNSKGCAELVTQAYRASFFASDSSKVCSVATARAGNVIGGGDWSRDRLIPDMVRSFGEGTSVEIRSPNSIRPWQHVLEPLCGYLLLAQALADSGQAFAEAWNFGPAEDDCRSVGYVAETLVRTWGRGASWRLSDRIHPHEATFLKVDASKAKARLAWRPRLGLADAIFWTGDWYRSQSAGASAKTLALSQIDAYETSGS